MKRADDLLRAARAHGDPTDADRARVWSAISARIEGAPSTDGETDPPATASGPGLVAGVGIKVLLVVLVALGLGGAIVFGVTRPSSRPERTAAVEPTEAPPVATPALTPVPEPVLAAPPPAPRAAAPVAALARAPKAPGRNEGAPLPAGEPLEPTGEAPERTDEAPAVIDDAPLPVAPTDSLAQELALLGAARAAVNQSKPRIALDRLDEYDHGFPAGVLAAEAAALRIDALCRLGRDREAAERAAAFLQAWPDSPLAHRVRQPCKPH